MPKQTRGATKAEKSATGDAKPPKSARKDVKAPKKSVSRKRAVTHGRAAKLELVLDDKWSWKPVFKTELHLSKANVSNRIVSFKFEKATKFLVIRALDAEGNLVRRIGRQERLAVTFFDLWLDEKMANMIVPQWPDGVCEGLFYLKPFKWCLPSTYGEQRRLLVAGGYLVRISLNNMNTSDPSEEETSEKPLSNSICHLDLFFDVTTADFRTKEQYLVFLRSQEAEIEKQSYSFDWSTEPSERLRTYLVCNGAARSKKKAALTLASRELKLPIAFVKQGVLSFEREIKLNRHPRKCIPEKRKATLSPPRPRARAGGHLHRHVPLAAGQGEVLWACRGQGGMDKILSEYLSSSYEDLNGDPLVFKKKRKPKRKPPKRKRQEPEDEAEAGPKATKKKRQT